MKPLQGITVLDISRLLPGGFASLLLARQGARVIKVEQPGVGDYYRALTGDKEFVALGHFQEINSGKELITLDLKTKQGKEVFGKLIKKSDVLIENFRPGTLKKLGLSYPVLSKWNRRLILCSITGAGQRGHAARLAGHDLNYLALSGLLSLLKDSAGRPVIPDFQIIDLAAGYRSAFLILGALCRRARTRRGCWIDSSMLDAGKEMARLYGNDAKSPFETLPNYRIYPTRDRRTVAFAALEPKFIRNFGNAIGKTSPRNRLHQRGLKKLFASRSAGAWSRLEDRHDFCLSPVLTVGEACGKRRAGPMPRMGRDNAKIFRWLRSSK